MAPPPRPPKRKATLAEAEDTPVAAHVVEPAWAGREKRARPSEGGTAARAAAGAGAVAGAAAGAATTGGAGSQNGRDLVRAPGEAGSSGQHALQQPSSGTALDPATASVSERTRGKRKQRS